MWNENLMQDVQETDDSKQRIFEEREQNTTKKKGLFFVGWPLSFSFLCYMPSAALSFYLFLSLSLSFPSFERR